MAVAAPLYAAPVPTEAEPSGAQALTSNEAVEQISAVTADWWQQFDDPLMVDLIDRAIATNPDLHSAQAVVRASQSQAVITGATLKPELDGSSSASQNDGRSSYGAGVDAGWDLDIFGGNRDNLRASEADLAATTASLQDMQISLAVEVATNYITLRQAQAQADILVRNLAAQRETAELIEARFRVGLDSELEFTQARLSVGQLLAQLPEQEKVVSQSMHSLALLVGEEPEALIAQLRTVTGVPYMAHLHGNPSINAELVRRRPDLRAAEHAVAAAAFRRDAAEADRYPSFRLGGALNFSSLDAADLFDSANLARSLLGSISVPLFNGGRLKEQVNLRDAQHEQAVNQYRKTLLTALGEVADAQVDMASSEQRIPQMTENLVMARDTLDLAFTRYQAGAVDFQTVLDSQRQVLSAEEALLHARVATSLAAINLYRALAGSW
ncbi:efflux transporter outer membrane subunit [Microbulbifer elongatus]|uniref:efflux transporter outer membrane subunit n=1 Tax=Microbulbifer elongatus TaxID=86173 RepID=UPI001E2BA0A4|nr:efflux transporter outer membrane subunit [Microbulbifer elongatus]